MPKEQNALVELSEPLVECLQDALNLKHSSTPVNRYEELRNHTIANMAQLIKRAITGGVTPFSLRKVNAGVEYINRLVKAGRTKLDPLHWAILELARLLQLIKDQVPSWQLDLCCEDAETYIAAR